MLTTVQLLIKLCSPEDRQLVLQSLDGREVPCQANPHNHLNDDKGPSLTNCWIYIADSVWNSDTLLHFGMTSCVPLDTLCMLFHDWLSVADTIAQRIVSYVITRPFVTVAPHLTRCATTVTASAEPSRDVKNNAPVSSRKSQDPGTGSKAVCQWSECKVPIDRTTELELMKEPGFLAICLRDQDDPPFKINWATYSFDSVEAIWKIMELSVQYRKQALGNVGGFFACGFLFYPNAANDPNRKTYPWRFHVHWSVVDHKGDNDVYDYSIEYTPLVEQTLYFRSYRWVTAAGQDNILRQLSYFFKRGKFFLKELPRNSLSREAARIVKEIPASSELFGQELPLECCRAHMSAELAQDRICYVSDWLKEHRGV